MKPLTDLTDRELAQNAKHLAGTIHKELPNASARLRELVRRFEEQR